MPQTILVVDDEIDLLELVAHHLKQAGYAVVTASRGGEVADLARRTSPDVVLLDIMLPDLQGTEILKQLRADPATASIPVIFLTARGEEVDRVVGFELGADDYVAKPFSLRELTLRLRALLRRTAAGSGGEESLLEAHGIRLDRNRHDVKVGGKSLDLTATEFRLLSYLMARPGLVLSREQLLENVWGTDVSVTVRTVDTHVKRLRSKLMSAARGIETVRGVGYRFRG